MKNASRQMNRIGRMNVLSGLLDTVTSSRSSCIVRVYYSENCTRAAAILSFVCDDAQSCITEVILLSFI